MKQPPKENTRSPYKDPVSSTFLGVIAAMILCGGVICIIVGLIYLKQTLGLPVYIGIVCIVISAFLFVVVNLSYDVHRMEYDMLTLLQENRSAQEQILQLLKSQNTPHIPQERRPAPQPIEKKPVQKAYFSSNREIEL